MNKLQQTADLGQSIWLDYLDRSFIESGELKELIDQGIRGVTSNPAIFQKAIAEGDSYDEAIAEMAAAGKSDLEIYEALAIKDIQRTADLLLPVYARSNRADGFVSLEVSPRLARDFVKTGKTQGLVSAGDHVYRRSLHGLHENADVLGQVARLGS